MSGHKFHSSKPSYTPTSFALWPLFANNTVGHSINSIHVCQKKNKNKSWPDMQTSIDNKDRYYSWIQGVRWNKTEKKKKNKVYHSLTFYS